MKSCLFHRSLPSELAYRKFLRVQYIALAVGILDPQSLKKNSNLVVLKPTSSSNCSKPATVLTLWGPSNGHILQNGYGSKKKYLKNSVGKRKIDQNLWSPFGFSFRPKANCTNLNSQVVLSIAVHGITWRSTSSCQGTSSE